MPQLYNMHMVLLTFALTLVCCVSSGAQGTNSAPGGVPAGWHTYTDDTYRFALSYPDDLGILPERTAAQPGGALKRVRFQLKQILSGQFAELEPAQFTIEVFRATPAMPLADWLRSVAHLPAGAAITPMTVKGAREAVRVQQPQQLAPNDFYYFATTEYVYKLIPLGQYASDMLASFRLL